MIKDLLDKNKLTLYQCSKQGNIPYTTLSEIVRGKTSLLNCSADTVYKLSKVLNVSMEDLLLQQSENKRLSYDIFRSNVCHRLKEEGDFDFIINTLKNDSVNYYWNKKWYFETFYLLAMVDYISRIHNLPLCNKYDTIRLNKLSKKVYPKDVVLAEMLAPQLNIKGKTLRRAIKEFLNFNIVECEVRDVR